MLSPPRDATVTALSRRDQPVRTSLQASDSPVSNAVTFIDCSRDDASRHFAALRDKLSPKGNVVSEAGRQRTIELFGEPLSPQQVVERICADVRQRGLPAVL